jgi:hypothetical protein
MVQDKSSDSSELISMRGNRDLWIDFTNKIRKEKGKTVWDVIEPMLKEYIKKSK